MGSPCPEHLRRDCVPGEAPGQKVGVKTGVKNESAPGHAQCVPGGGPQKRVHFGTLGWDLFLPVLGAETKSDLKPEHTR